MIENELSPENQQRIQHPYMFPQLDKEKYVLWNTASPSLVYNRFRPRSARRIRIAVGAESGVAYSSTWYKTQISPATCLGCPSGDTAALTRSGEGAYYSAIAISQSQLVG